LFCAALVFILVWVLLVSEVVGKRERGKGAGEVAVEPEEANGDIGMGACAGLKTAPVSALLLLLLLV
jgi:hypothetical protein